MTPLQYVTGSGQRPMIQRPIRYRAGACQKRLKKIERKWADKEKASVGQLKSFALWSEHDRTRPVRLRLMSSKGNTMFSAWIGGGIGRKLVSLDCVSDFDPKTQMRASRGFYDDSWAVRQRAMFINRSRQPFVKV